MTRHSRLFGKCFTVLLVMLTASALASEPEKCRMLPEKRAQQIFEEMNGSGNDIERAARWAARERAETIDLLIPMVEPENKENYTGFQRTAASYVLGELRAIEAAPALARALGEDPSYRFIGGRSIGWTPFWHSLVKIGHHALPALVENIKTSDDSGKISETLTAMLHILGLKEYLVDFLERLAAESDDEKERTRIRSALGVAQEKFKPGGGSLFIGLSDHIPELLFEWEKPEEESTNFEEN